MSLGAIVGHEQVRRDLGGAALRGELPGSLLLHGPRGVGKQRIGLWLGQLLLCEAPNAAGACGACAACRLSSRIEHPDLHWFFPLPRPKASGDKLGDALEDARAAELAARRAAPWSTGGTGEAASYYLAMIQTLRRIAVARPAMASRKVFIIGDAELLVPQESSQESANALLKLLEEPPSGTYFILTASDPESLLPTIRSRLLPVRLRALPETEVAAYLTSAHAFGADEARLAARLGQGAIGRALGYRAGPGTDGPLGEFRERARELLAAAAGASPGPRLAAAHATAPAAARGGFSDTLDALLAWLRDLAAVATGATDAVVNTDALAFLGDLARRLPGAASGAPRAIKIVEDALDLAQGNVNPQLVLAAALRDVHHALATPEQTWT